MRPLLTAFVFLICLAGGGTPAFAIDAVTQSADGRIRLSGGVGLLDLTARELVYDGGTKLSELDWASRAVPVYAAAFAAEIDPAWSVGASLRYAAGGNSDMTDYDWIEPFNTGTGKSDWSDRSIHPDTQLKYYVDGDLSLTRSLFSADTASLGLTGGFRYTDVRWDAYGGSYIYSTDSARDTTGDFADGERGISYRQRIPVFYAGVSGATSIGAFGFSGSAKLGVTSGINDIDQHWLRGLRFDDRIDPAPVGIVSAQITYALTPQAGVYVGADVENVFSQRGDTSILDRMSGDTEEVIDGAGASFRSLQLSVGLNARF